MRQLRSTTALPALALLVLASCSRDPTQRLADRYPGVAGSILASDGFVRTGDGFQPKAPAAAAADPGAPARGGLDLWLPANGADEAWFTTPDAVQVRVRERGAGATATPVGAALAYARTGGTSYWTAMAKGFEEWIEVEDAGESAVAEWEVAGASLRQAGDSVEVVDGAGVAILHVTASEAYRPGGGTARAWLRAQGAVISLFTDARGPALIDPSWTTVDIMATARRYHTATLLFTGKVLVVGGNTTGTIATAAVELYDPSTGTWSNAHAMANARYQHTATLLPDGTVLVAGGTNGTSAVGTAELYDPATDTWSSVGSLLTARQNHTATLVTVGAVQRVLVVGGGTGAGGNTALASAELYTPSTRNWVATGSLTTRRQEHSATQLANGRVLVAGGLGGANGTTVLASAELYDPAAETWSAVSGSLPTARYGHAAVLLANGNVLFAGGVGSGGMLSSAELWNSATGAWSSTTSMSDTRQAFPAVLLPSGKVLVAGGFRATGANPNARATTEIFDPTAGTWSGSTALPLACGACTGTILPSGRVLVAGGSGGNTVRRAAYVYDPTDAGAFRPTGDMPAGREFHTATLLQNGSVLVVGGSSTGAPVRSVTPLATAALYDPNLGTWTATGSLQAPARTFHTANLLPNGKVLVAAGFGSGGLPLGSAQLYDPASGTWTATGDLGGIRYWHTATLLPSGKVLVAGGSSAVSPTNPQLPPSALGTAELYDPATGNWSTTGSFPSGRTRWGHTATLLQNGKVLVVGGSNGGSASLQTADLYDPATGTWTATGNPVAARRFHSAILLPSGKVLLIGGLGGAGPAALDTTELYDPQSGTFAASGTLATARYRAQPVLLHSGFILMAGGTAGTADALDTAELYEPTSETWSAASNTMSSLRHGMTLTLLQSGKALAVGGDTNTAQNGTNPATATCDLYDESQAPLPAAIPAITSAGSNVPGGSITVTGKLFTGLSEASGWGTASSPTNYPLVELTAAGTNAERYASVTSYTATSLSAVLPATAQTGPYLLRVVVNGVRSEAVQMTIYPSLAITPGTATTPPRGPIAFSASGGSGAYTWSLAPSASGGSIDPATGAYVAGATGNVTDVVRVIDTVWGNSTTVSVTVTAGLSIAPATISLAPLAPQTFTASGGSWTGYTWSLTTNASGGSINASTGAYRAGTTGSVTDVVQVTDSLGNVATRNVTVTPGVTISPATASAPPRGSQTFTASGGSGTGWTWSLSVNASGGSIGPASGVYVAGTTPSVTDVVTVTDSLGNSATRAVTVTAGVSISPASAVVRDGTTRTFTASGGSGTGWTWSLSSNASGGSIGSSTGSYQAGTADGVDVVRVTDSLGNAATATATVTRLFASFAFDVLSAGQGATVLATLTVYDDTADPVTVTPPSFAELALTGLAPAADVIDPAPTSLEPGASARFTYALTVTGSPGASYLAAATAQTSSGPTNLATTPAGIVAEVRVDWTPAAMVRERSGPPYRFSLRVTNDGTFPVTRVEIGNPQPASFTGLAADPTTCTSADLPTVTAGAGLLDFWGTLLPGASTTLCFEFAEVPVVARKTSYPFTVTVTRSGGSPPAATYDRSVRLDVPPPDVSMPSVLSDANGQTLAWINSGTSDAPHDGVVVFRTAAPDVPTIPADYVDYRVSATGDTLYADASYSPIASLADATVGVYNYRICNHDPDFVYSNCNSGFWNGQGWLDSAVATPGGWTQQLGGAIYTLPGVLPGVSVSVATNAPAVFTLDADAGDRSADPLALLSLPSRSTPVVPLGSGQTLLFAADSLGTVTAVDVAAGAQAWRAAKPGESFVAGVIVTLRQYASAAFQAAYSGDVLFVGSTSHKLFALDAETGQTLWTLDAGAAIRASVRYDASNNWLYVATAGGGVLAYDLGTSSSTTPPVLAAGWTNPGGSYRLGCTGGTVTTDLACIDDGGLMLVLDRSTGAVRTSHATGLSSPQTIWTVRTASPGFVVSDAHQVQRLALSGTAWTRAGQWAPAGVTLSPLVVFTGLGTIYVGGSDSTLHKLSLADASDTGLGVAVGSQAGAVQIGPPAYDVVNDLFLFGTDDGRLWAVKTF